MGLKKILFQHLLPQALSEAIEEFVSHLEVLPYDAKASQHYGQIKASLEKKGGNPGAGGQVAGFGGDGP